MVVLRGVLHSVAVLLMALLLMLLGPAWPI
jgi:hypothetical protein